MRDLINRWLRRTPPGPPPLQPVGTADSLEALKILASHADVQAAEALEHSLLRQHASATNHQFSFAGHCAACGSDQQLVVDAQWGGVVEADGWRPNWRERLQCPTCGMNNRQRLMVELIRTWAAAHHGGHIYFMEQVTPIFTWAQQALAGSHGLSGSEYLGPQYKGGETVNGVRHEDVERLSFNSASLDLIVSNDVFEHVPDPWRAFRECRRALRDGAVMLATLPFYDQMASSRVRAHLSQDGIEHLLPAQYHGNPVSADGSLVFTDFGWDVLERLREAGFRRAVFEAYVSAERGHLGGMQLVLRAQA